jgi:zinc transport system substrate-binding protein
MAHCSKTLCRFFIAFGALLCIMHGSCRQPKHAAVKQMAVFVSIAPQKYFVERIGGKHVAVSVLVPPGASPHAYEPKPSQMIALSKARLYFAVGVEFERAWLARVEKISPALTIVHTEEAIDKIEMATSTQLQLHAGHSHASHEHHRSETPVYALQHMHAGLDPHIWLSPRRVAEMGKTIVSALSRQAPDHARSFVDAYTDFTDSIASLSNDIKTVLAHAPSQTFMVFHPSWGYFADEFGLNQLPIELEGKEPTLKELAMITGVARRNNIKTIFVQPQMSYSAAQVIARTIDATLTRADPLAENWAENLRSLAREIADKAAEPVQ